MTTDCTGDGTTSISCTTSDLGADGVRNVYIACKDSYGNKDTTSTATHLTYTQDTTPPVRSSGSPSSTLSCNTTSTTLSLTTDENATCKYGTTTNTAYASVANTFTTTSATIHSSTITGLSPNTSYNYYVRCQDTVGNANTDDYVISFNIDSCGGGLPAGALNPPAPPARRI